MRHASGRDLFHIHLLIHAAAFLYVSLQLPALLKVTAFPCTFFIFHFPFSHPLIWICGPRLDACTQTHQLQRKGPCSLLCVAPLSSLSLLQAGKAGLKETDPSSTPGPDNGVSLPQGSLGEWVPVEVCLNARGSVCPRLAYPALMDVSFLLIAELGKKMNISFFMHSLCYTVLY